MGSNLTKISAKFVGYVILALIILGYIFLWNDPEAAKQEKLLQNEFQVIATLPGVQIISKDLGHKEGQAHVGAKYFTHATYSQIRQHYDLELKKHGWLFRSEEDVNNWGSKVQGAKIVIYEKGEYQLSLEYEGNNAGFTFAIGLLWGLGK